MSSFRWWCFVGCSGVALLIVLMQAEAVHASNSNSNSNPGYYNNYNNNNYNNNEWNSYEERRPQGQQQQQQEEQQQPQRNDYYNNNNNNNNEQGNYYADRKPQEYPNPPPRERQDPSSSSSSSSSTNVDGSIPIHYQFPSRQEPSPPTQHQESEEKNSLFRGRQRKRRPDEEEDETDQVPPLTSLGTLERPDDDNDKEEENYDRRSGNDGNSPRFASPRQDLVTRYRATAAGRWKLSISSTTVGVFAGGFLGKSTLGSSRGLAVSVGLLFWLWSWMRNAYGELVRALGMSLILALQRTTRIRKSYPTGRHIRSSLGMAPRRPFPSRQQQENGDYPNLFVLIAMGFMGSLCGGNLPLLPTWIGSLAGAGTFVLSTTPPTAQGDLARTMGMRVVVLVEEVLDINTQLRVVQKLGTVSGKILDKILIMDRKHRIKDRIAAGVSYAYNRVVSSTGGGNNNNDDDDNDNRRRGRPPPRGERRRENETDDDDNDDGRRGRGDNREDEDRRRVGGGDRDRDRRRRWDGPPPDVDDPSRRRPPPNDRERMDRTGYSDRDDRGPRRYNDGDKDDRDFRDDKREQAENKSKFDDDQDDGRQGRRRGWFGGS